MQWKMELAFENKNTLTLTLHGITVKYAIKFASNSNLPNSSLREPVLDNKNKLTASGDSGHNNAS